MQMHFHQSGLRKSIKRKRRRRIPLYFREQRNILPSIIIDTHQIEQPMKYLAHLSISFLQNNDQSGCINGCLRERKFQYHG